VFCQLRPSKSVKNVAIARCVILTQASVQNVAATTRRSTIIDKYRDIGSVTYPKIV